MKHERTIDLDGEQHRTLKRIIETHIPHKEVWAYGSRVNWKASISADLDLVVFDCDFSTLAAFREALEESNLVISVDVMDWGKIPDDFKENIKKKYVVVQKRQLLIAGWKQVRLGNLVDITSSKRIFYKEYIKTGVPFYRSKEIIEKHNKQDISTDLFISEERFNEIKQKHGAPEAEDLLLTAVGTLGVPYIVKQNERFYFKDGNLLWFRNFNKDLFNKFIYYWIISPIGIRTLQITNIGSTQPALTIDNLNKLSINIPPLPEQKIIAEILSGLDDKINLLLRQNKTLEITAQTFFRKHIISNPRRTNWKKGKLGDIVEIETGEKTAKREPNYLEIGDIDISTRDYNIDGKEKRTVSGAVKVPKDTLLISKVRATRGAITITKHEINVSGAFTKIKCCEKIGYLFAQQQIFFKYLGKVSAGSTYPVCKDSDVLNYEITVPPQETMDKFNEIIIPYFDKIRNNRLQIHVLENSRNTLLPKLLNGKIMVKS